MDRDVYFPGEEPIVSVLFHNPTSQVLQVPEPIQGGAGGFNLLEAEHNPATVKRLGSPWRYMRAHPFDWNNLPDDARSRLVQPGETFQIDVSTTDGCLGKSRLWQGWIAGFPKVRVNIRLSIPILQLLKRSSGSFNQNLNSTRKRGFRSLPRFQSRLFQMGRRPEEHLSTSELCGQWCWDIRERTLLQ
ncbi:MAG: hypothetical protein IT165_32615 [Bryobacterales bacterium]|nr:hypothetical protein [Bryobacterales bacterium]